MNKRRVIAIAIAAACGAALAGAWAGRWAKPSQPETKESEAFLAFDSATLDFGEVWATREFDWDLRLRNTTDSDVTLESLAGDCSCVSIARLPLVVGAGKSVSIKLRIDLTRRCMGVGPEPFASIPHPIVLHGVARAGTWTHAVDGVLQGRVKPAVLLSRRGVDFGRLWNPPPHLESSVIIRMAPGVELHAYEADDPARRLATQSPLTSGNGKRELVVRLDASTPPGRHRGELRIVPAEKTGKILDSVRLPVEWENLHEIQPDTTTVDFGALPLGTVAEQSLTLTSLAGKPFRLTECMAGEKSGMVFDKMPKEKADTFTLRVTLRVERAGEHADAVTVFGVTGSGEPFTVTCRTHYFGVSTAGQ